MTFLSTQVRHHLETLSESQDEPFFVYDLDKLAAHLAPLTQQSVVKLWYAVKANPLSAVIQTLDKAGFNFDVASRGELDQVLAQGIDAQRVLNTGPAKSKRQIQHFLDQGVTIFVAESQKQVHWLNEAASARNIQLSVLLRVQLRWPEGEKNPLGGNTLTPFGLGSSEWSQLDLTEFSNLDFVGLHIFQWGNMLDAEQLSSLWSQMVVPLLSLSKQLGFPLKILDLGGGLGIPYSESDTAINWSTLLDSLASIKAAAGVEELWMELGRYAVGECGYYANPVVETKENFNTHQAIITGGINHILRPAVTQQAFPVEVLRHSEAAPCEFTLHGPLCTALDHLGTHTLPSDLNEYDWLVFSQCGAYGFTESMPFFLCHPLAGEFIIQDNVLTCLRESASPDSYLR